MTHFDFSINNLISKMKVINYLFAAYNTSFEQRKRYSSTI